MMTGFHECTRKSTKWYKKIFLHLLDTVLLNSHIVYQQITGKEITSLQFRTNLMRGLLEEYSTLRCPTKGGRPALDTPSSKQRRLTKHMCVPCNTPLCAVQCLQEYHTLKHY
ncbi:hypothetical protein PO909_029363 [Leuciscus waleckii]